MTEGGLQLLVLIPEGRHQNELKEAVWVSTEMKSGVTEGETALPNFSSLDTNRTVVLPHSTLPMRSTWILRTAGTCNPNHSCIHSSWELRERGCDGSCQSSPDLQETREASGRVTQGCALQECSHCLLGLMILFSCQGSAPLPTSTPHWHDAERTARAAPVSHTACPDLINKQC